MTRLPTVMGFPSDTEAEDAPARCVEACCTNAGVMTVLGVTALDAAEAGEVPTAFVAVTVNVYAVPLVRPVTDVAVAGGVPVTVVDGRAVVPAYGVTVYDVIGEPPLAGAVHESEAEPFPATAVTPVGAAGAVGAAAVMCTVAAIDGTPDLLRMNSM
jgi:hypothetical protein